ncbi:MAG: DNA-directed RNA polymerase subunit beta', partial [Spirochaetota bacterium]
PVLLNRAPTLHRLGIQAFDPVIVEGKAIQLHPLVCHAFNADFDGDQMAVHLPLTQAAQVECWSLMLASKNLMNPANGMSVVFPSQDMVLGIYLLTKPRKGDKGEGRHFSSFNEVLKALDLKQLTFHSLIKVPNPVFTKENAETESRWLETTPGRVVFNMNIPKLSSYVNETLSDKSLRSLIESSFEENGASLTVELLDCIKDIGFRYATLLGCSIGLDDILVPDEKRGLIEESNQAVAKIQEQYRSGHITNEERYNRVVEVWSKTNEDLTRLMMDLLSEDQQGFNNVYIMADSGARGSRNQIRQLAGMRGLMAKPSGDIIELPIRSNFKEGLSVIEFFISTNGARKGLADTALKTADAGYLTRRLVDISQDVVVNQDDCSTINGIVMSALKDGEEIVESLADRVRGSYTLERVRHPITGELILDVNEEITDSLADDMERIGIEEVRVRTVLTCEARYGVCCKCYGRDLSTRKTVNVGEAVGILAAQSIGQPGTQLTMRTFHVGGTASTIAEDNKIALKYPVLVRDIQGHYLDMGEKRFLFTRKGYIFVSKILERHELGKKDKFLLKDGERVVKGVPIIKKETKAGSEMIEAQQTAFLVHKGKTLLLVAQDQRLEVRNGSNVNVRPGQIVGIDEPIAVFDPFSDPIISEQSGSVRFVDLINGVTLREELNEETGNIEKKIAEQFSQSLEPRIELLNDDGEMIGNYYLPGGSYLSVEYGAVIKAGRVLAKLLKESAKTQDITGGLPRVVELFEARQPKNATVLASITGTVHFRGLFKGKRLIIVEDEYGNESRHLIPQGRHLLVRDGDPVVVAEPLCDGPVNPHMVLDIQGENALQRFLVDEVQEVYRMQGVNINDKHIGVIIRQMMRKVEVMDVGDTQFIYGQQVDKYTFRTENNAVIGEGGRPAVARPLLQGITKASLNINSWVSAASFQETTRVLTNAAIAGNVDPLNGLKENVIIGHMIPAGTGMKKYRELQLYTEDMEDL